MGRDEDGTHQRVKNLLRETVNPAVIEHRGRIFKTMGDGFLAVFDSPLEAVRCALVIQQSMAMRNLSEPEDRKIQYRIGINLGDVIVENDDIFGDGVNVAARLQTLSEPGHVYISGGIYEQVKNKLVVGYQSLGDEKLKNITDPVRIYRVLPDLSAVSKAQARSTFSWFQLAMISIGLLGITLGGWSAWILFHASQTAQPGVVQPDPKGALTAKLSGSPSSAASSAAQSPRNGEVPATTGAQALAPPPRSTPPAPSPEMLNTPSQAQSPLSHDQTSAPPSQQGPTGPAPSPVPLPSPPSVSNETSVADAAITPPGARSPDSKEPFRECSKCPELIAIPAGSFEMGSNDIQFAKPVHQVVISKPFAIGLREVTFDEWDFCVAEGGCKYRPSDRGWGRGQRPVIDVSWSDTKVFLSWLSRKTGQNYRLPSEAEWEFVARSGAATPFSWGSVAKSGQANCEDCGPTPARRTLPSGSFQPNAFGVFDMAGNAAEWVEDCWNESYRGAPKDGSAWRRGQCELRVIRGGAFSNNANAVRPAARFRYDYDVRYYTNGFRVARDLP
jgi:formylglycine-generating enzyme required for sulfatase activity